MTVYITGITPTEDQHMHLKAALIKKAAAYPQIVEERAPLIPGVVDVRGRSEVTPRKISREIEAIPQLGAYGGAATLGGVTGAGIGALVSKDRAGGAILGGLAGAVAAPALLALASQKGLLKLQESTENK